MSWKIITTHTEDLTPHNQRPSLLQQTSINDTNQNTSTQSLSNS